MATYEELMAQQDAFAEDGGSGFWDGSGVQDTIGMLLGGYVAVETAKINAQAGTTAQQTKEFSLPAYSSNTAASTIDKSPTATGGLSQTAWLAIIGAGLLVIVLMARK